MHVSDARSLSVSEALVTPPFLVITEVERRLRDQYGGLSVVSTFGRRVNLIFTTSAGPELSYFRLVKSVNSAGKHRSTPSMVFRAMLKNFDDM